MQFTAAHYKQNKNKSAEICALCNMVDLFTGCAPWCAHSASYGRRVCSLGAHHIVLHTGRLKQSGQRLVGGGVDWTRLEANYIQPDTQIIPPIPPYNTNQLILARIPHLILQQVATFLRWWWWSSSSWRSAQWSWNHWCWRSTHTFESWWWMVKRIQQPECHDASMPIVNHDIPWLLP